MKQKTIKTQEEDDFCDGCKGIGLNCEATRINVGYLGDFCEEYANEKGYGISGQLKKVCRKHGKHYWHCFIKPSIPLRESIPV